MDTESTHRQKELYTRVSGRMISNMARGLRSGWIMQNLKGISYMEKKKGLEFWLFRMGLSMKDSSKIIKLVEREFLDGLLAKSMRESGVIIRWMGWGILNVQMGKFMRVSF